MNKENNKKEKLFQKLRILKKNEVIYINFNEDIANVLKLIDIQVRAYENLFMSYMNNTCEEANQMNLQKFLDKYSSLCLTRDNLMRTELNKCIGEDNYKYVITNNFAWTFNYIVKIIEIKRQ